MSALGAALNWQAIKMEARHYRVCRPNSIIHLEFFADRPRRVRSAWAFLLQSGKRCWLGPYSVVHESFSSVETVHGYGE
jgi:hypothetical protein